MVFVVVLSNLFCLEQVSVLPMFDVSMFHPFYPLPFGENNTTCTVHHFDWQLWFFGLSVLPQFPMQPFKKRGYHYTTKTTTTK